MSFANRFEERDTIRDDKKDVYIMFDTVVGEYCSEFTIKVLGGIKHATIRTKVYPNIKEIVEQIKKESDYTSKRPYTLRQRCDGSTDSCVHALCYNFCDALGLNYDKLYKEAYPDITYEDNKAEVIEFANWQGVEYPKQWDTKAFEGLIERLLQINNRSFAQRIEEEVEELKEENRLCVLNSI